MRILWLTWKDKQHPQAGGAEVVSSELGKRLAAEGHEVLFITGGYEGGAKRTTIDGYKVIRLGNRYTVYWHAYKYIKKNLRDWPELVIEEINTVPFFSRLYLKNVKRYLFFHMLCRKIWFYQLSMPLSMLGFLLEPLYLRVLKKDPVITVSNSTKMDLVRNGYHHKQVHIISEGILLPPVNSVEKVDKFPRPTIISLGAIRAMKQTMDQVKAFEITKKVYPKLQLKIAGDASSDYGKKVLNYIAHSRYKKDIEYLGKVSPKQKKELLKKGHLISVTSIKEGWGLIVTEAASQGTPAVVYDVDGLRDSVRNTKTGLITTDNTPYKLASCMWRVLTDKDLYTDLQRNGWQWSKSINFDKAYFDFMKVVK